MKERVISVLIPTHKPGSYIERCLNSINRQIISNDKFKVYIALNGTKDEYEKYIINILESCTFNYEYTYIVDAGVSNARNKLLDISKEPFVTFIDDDDLITENYLSELLKVADNETIGISNVYSFDNSVEELDSNYLTHAFEYLQEEEYSLFRARKYFSSPIGKLIHRSIIQNERFDNRLSIGEDSLFMAKISKNFKSLRKSHPTAAYLIHERVGSTTRKKINRISELKRLVYLISKYTTLLFKGYNIIFVFSRIAASFKHLKRIFKQDHL